MTRGVKLDRKPRCPRCGVGYDTDGDGDCAFCARLIDCECGRGPARGSGVCGQCFREAIVRDGELAGMVARIQYVDEAAKREAEPNVSHAPSVLSVVPEDGH